MAHITVPADGTETQKPFLVNELHHKPVELRLHYVLHRLLSLTGEFQDPAVATLVTHDSKAGKLCLLSGERHVAVAKTNERAFRTAVKKLGYVLPR